MKVTEYQPGTPCWVDLASPDMDASKAFYTALFGWTAHTAPQPEAGGYTIFNKGDAAAAAAGPLFTGDQPPAWSWYAATPDADETARKVEAAGGKVLVAPFDVLDAGRMAVFLDTSGTPFSVWQAGTMLGALATGLPLLFLPLAIPIVVGGVGASVTDAPGRYLAFLALYDALFATICWASFEYVVTE